MYFLAIGTLRIYLDVKSEDSYEHFCHPNKKHKITCIIHYCGIYKLKMCLHLNGPNAK